LDQAKPACSVVEHEALNGVAVVEGGCRRKVVFENEDVVNEIACGHRPSCAKTGFQPFATFRACQREGQSRTKRPGAFPHFKANTGVIACLPAGHRDARRWEKFATKPRRMPKEGEINFPNALDEAGRRHAVLKPFSDDGCGRYLRDIGAVMELLPLPPARLLDLGAGTAWTSAFFAKRGYAVTAQDISPGMIEMARRNRAVHELKNLEFLVQDYEQMDFACEFDCAVFFDSLHHAEDESAALRSAYRALKSGGVCVTAEPEQGHAAATSSREFAARYLVTEKDMYPAHIIALAREIGFRRCEVFERHHAPRLLFSSGSLELPPTPSRVELALRYFASGLRCLFAG